MCAVSRANPKLIVAANNLAWILATNPSSEFRDGKAAVVAAKLACEATGYRDYRFFDTLAVSLAEAGEFAEAAKVCERGMKMASEAKDDQTIELLEGRIELFNAGKPFREE